MNPVVYLVDDDPEVLKALKRLLTSEGFQVLSSASTQDFLTAYDSALPGCIVLDIAMPGMSGLELQALLHDRGIGCPIIFLTGHGDIPSSVRAMKAGAMDFLTKPVDAATLLEAVQRGVAHGNAAHQHTTERQRAQELLGTLTPRERELVPHLVSGRLNKQIAAELGVAEKTIKVHRSRVMHKLRIRSPVELLGFLEKAGQR